MKKASPIISRYKPAHDFKMEKHSNFNFPKQHYPFLILLTLSLILYPFFALFHISNEEYLIPIAITLTLSYLLSLQQLPKRYTFYLLGYAILLLFVLYVISEQLLLSYHLLLLFSVLPFILIAITNLHLLDIPYNFFLDMEVTSLYNLDLFTHTHHVTEHHKEKEKIYIDVFSLSEGFQDKKFKSIKNHYIRLVKFWYAHEYYLFKLRYYFPVLALLFGIMLFFIALYTLKINLSTPTYLEVTSIMSLFLAIFYLSVTFHVNSFLHSKFYMGNILKALNDTHYDNHEYRHQLRLFLDKNFLIYVHDRKHDRYICVNNNKSFQDLISKEKFDKEGRNHILTVFISFILILLIEVLVNFASNLSSGTGESFSFISLIFN
jgi:hypothetical protein